MGAKYRMSFDVMARSVGRIQRRFQTFCTNMYAFYCRRRPRLSYKLHIYIPVINK